MSLARPHQHWGDGSPTIGAVLPLKIFGRHYLWNIARCDILLSSLSAYAQPDLLTRILVVVPGREYNQTARALSHWSNLPLQIISEDDLLPIFHQHKRVSGWYRQQLIKLLAATLLDTTYCLTLDPDVILCKPVRREHLLVDGKALLEPEARDVHRNWWSGSARVLQTDVRWDQPGMSVTPALLSRAICELLFKRIEGLYQDHWASALLNQRHHGWTEYTLYHLAAEHHDLLERYHSIPTAGGHRLLCASNVWAKGEPWDAARCFGDEDSGFFTVVQSHTGMTPVEIVKRLPSSLQTGREFAVSPWIRMRSLMEDVMRKTVGWV